MFNQESANQIVDAVFKVLTDGSKQDYIGEKISQLEHSLQAAASARNASKFFFFFFDLSNNR
jgi:predicted HD phosphohydrolase